jgi:hypothetical protein
MNDIITDIENNIIYLFYVVCGEKGIALCDITSIFDS